MNVHTSVLCFLAVPKSPAAVQFLLEIAEYYQDAPQDQQLQSYQTLEANCNPDMDSDQDEEVSTEQKYNGAVLQLHAV